MDGQVRVKINKNTIKILTVASSNEEFKKSTIIDLKRKALSLFPGVNDTGELRVIFGKNELEDDKTFESCNIENLSLLVVVLRMPGGKSMTLLHKT
uniref:Ubiquitin-like domain-containing protein n=1 Tax=Sinocyclocheilus anshuiensis TaxID=1608454 RepID=A0A671PKI3_9TELE